MKVTVKRIGTGVNHAVLFAGDPEGLDVSGLGTVCLSRNKPGSCNYPLNELEEHDYHAPSFSTKEAAEVYEKRVKDDIRALLEAAGYSLEIVGQTSIGTDS